MYESSNLGGSPGRQKIHRNLYIFPYSFIFTPEAPPAGLTAVVKIYISMALTLSNPRDPATCSTSFKRLQYSQNSYTILRLCCRDRSNHKFSFPVRHSWKFKKVQYTRIGYMGENVVNMVTISLQSTLRCLLHDTKSDVSSHCVANFS